MTMMRMVMLIVYISSTLHTYIYTYIHDGEHLCIGVRYIFTPCAHAERGRERERERERERWGGGGGGVQNSSTATGRAMKVVMTMMILIMLMLFPADGCDAEEVDEGAASKQLLR